MREHLFIVFETQKESAIIMCERPITVYIYFTNNKLCVISKLL